VGVGGLPIGKMMLNMLNTTSVIASCASAWTLEFLINLHQSQHPNLMNTVLAIMSIAGKPSWTM
jgi:hypothetical protein